MTSREVSVPRSHIVGFGVAFAMLLLGTAARASNTASPGKSWAILIGVEQYQKANPLRFTINDVTQIAETLSTWGGYDPNHILKVIDDAADPAHRPDKAAIMKLLPSWLARPAAGDQVIVYFSGHGFRDKDGKTYLAPIDVDPADPAGSGIPIEWLREQIAACPAGFKLLILDACHAGSEKGENDDTGIAAEELGRTFRNLDNVVTLASSTATQKSQIWEDKEQSLFSYWLNQGLKGHADADGDGNVDVDELYKFVSRSVRSTAEARFPRKQDPVRIIRPGTQGVPVVEQLQPQRLKQVLNDMAERLTDSIIERKFSRVGVLEFTNDTRLGELLGADYGALGKWCSDELERQLTDLANGKFQMVNKMRLKTALEAQGFSLGDLASTEKLQRLSRAADNMPVIALGTLRNRSGRIVGLQCKLVQTNSDEQPSSVGGMAALNENEWAMLGHSAVVGPNDYRPEAPTLTSRPKPPEEQLIARLDDQAQRPHPLMNQSFPFRVKLMVQGATPEQVTERQGVFKGNDYFVPLRKGEVYEIWIENHSGEVAVMRLLVDGLNTLPQKETPKGVSVTVVGPRVNLDDARAWELDPKVSEVMAVRGFVTETGTEGKLKEFTVVDAEKSLAARQKFTDQIGLITAAFYAPKAGSRGGLGTAAGKERTENIGTAHGYVPGNLLGVLNIRYVDADSSALAGQ